MANFIEVTLVDGKKELISTNVIQMVYPHEGKTFIYYIPGMSQYASTEIKESYEEIKKALE